MLPAHLRDYAEQKVGQWADALLEASRMTEDREYRVKRCEGQPARIEYVDYDNTGLVDSAMNFSNGVHQVLELEHGFHLRPQLLTTAFVSSFSYFQHYDANLVGLTGTLGTPEARRMLRELFPNVIIAATSA